MSFPLMDDKTVILLDIVSPLSVLTAVITYDLGSKLIFSLAIPFALDVRL